MGHDAFRHGLAGAQREHRPAVRAEVQLDDQVGLVAGHPPGARRPGLTARGRARRGDDLVGRLGERRQLSAGRAPTGLLGQIGDAHASAAVAARDAMPGTGVPAAHGTLRGAREGEGLTVQVAYLAVRLTRVCPVRVEQRLEVGEAVGAFVLQALRRVHRAGVLAAGRARRELVRRVDGLGLVRALCAVALTYEAA